MDYAFQALRKALDGVTLAADTGMDELESKLNQIWTQTVVRVSEQTAENPDLRDVYRVVLNQAQNATVEFRWLGKPKLFYSPAKGGKAPSRLRYLLLLPTLGMLVFLLIWYGMAKNYTGSTLAAASLVTLGVYLIISALDAYKMVHQIGEMRAEQQIDPVLVRRTLEKIAENADANAASLTARFQQEKGGGKAEMDGLELARKLLKLNYEGETVPASALSEVRRYLDTCGVETVEYTPQRKALFTLLPSDGTKTLQPALVRKVRTVRNGESVEEEVLLEKGVACVNAGAKE